MLQNLEHDICVMGLLLYQYLLRPGEAICGVEPGKLQTAINPAYRPSEVDLHGGYRCLSGLKSASSVPWIPIPVAICLSSFEIHSKDPGASSAAALPLLELGLEEALPVVNETMRALGRLKRTSICESDGAWDLMCATGRLKARRADGVFGVIGVALEDAMVLCGSGSINW